VRPQGSPISSRPLRGAILFDVALYLLMIVILFIGIFDVALYLVLTFCINSTRALLLKRHSGISDILFIGIRTLCLTIIASCGYHSP